MTKTTNIDEPTPEEQELLNENRFIGSPCRKHGHRVRYKRNNVCVLCARERQREHQAETYEKYGERIRQQQRKNNQTEKRKKYMREYMAEYRKRCDNEKEAQKRYNERHRDEINAKARAKYATRTDEERLAYNERMREYRRKRIKNMSPEELRAFRDKNNAYKRELRARMKEENK